MRHMHAHTETGEHRAANLQRPSRLELGSYWLRSKTTLTTQLCHAVPCCDAACGLLSIRWAQAGPWLESWRESSGMRAKKNRRRADWNRLGRYAKTWTDSLSRENPAWSTLSTQWPSGHSWWRIWPCWRKRCLPAAFVMRNFGRRVMWHHLTLLGTACRAMFSRSKPLPSFMYFVWIILLILLLLNYSICIILYCYYYLYIHPSQQKGDRSA